MGLNEGMGIIIICMTFVLNIVDSFMFCFFRFKETFSPKLSLTCSSLIKHTLVNKENVYRFLIPLFLFLQNLETPSEYSYFDGNIVISI